MKNKLASIVAIFFLIILVQVSCTKSTDIQSPSSSNSIGPQPKLQFKANGVIYNFDAAYDVRVGWHYYTSFSKSVSSYPEYFQYSIYGRDPKGIRPNLNSFGLLLPKNELIAKKTYSCSSDIWIKNMKYNYGTLVLTITNIQNGYADGTFSGSISYSSSSSSLTITEGQFSNVPIFND